MNPGDVRAVLVTNIPTPYRSAWFEQLQRQAGLEFTAVYMARSHPKRRRWQAEVGDHRHVFLPGRLVERGERAVHLNVGVRRTLDDLDPDLVMIGGWDQPATWLARHWCLRRRVPFVVCAESHEGSGDRRTGWTVVARRRFVAGSAGAMVTSEEAAAFVRTLGLRGPVLIQPNPVVPPPGRRSSERGASVLFLGALNHRKRPNLVLDACDRLARSAEGRVTVDVVGEGPLADELVTRSSQLRCDVTLYGHLAGSELEDRWAAAACLVLPSIADPAPLVLSEAVARRVPFVCSDRCGGASVLIAQGAAGTIVPATASLAAWAEAIGGAMSQPSGAVVASVFPDAAAGAVAGFIRQLLGSPR